MMENSGQQLKQLRNKLTLTLEQVAEETRIRNSIITSIENDNTDSISTIYLNAYKKTLFDFYEKASNNATYLANIKNISVQTFESTSNFQSQKLQNNKNLDKSNSISENKLENNQTKKSTYDNYKNYTTDNESNFTAVPIDTTNIKKKIDVTETESTLTNKQIKREINSDNIIKIDTEIHTETTRKKFKQSNFSFLNKKILKNSITLQKLLIYIFCTTVLAVIVFFVFIYDINNEKNNAKQQTKYDSTADSVINITSKDDNIYNYFENDSVVLVAYCKDTAWVKVELDNKKTDELLMKPGMENKWSALEKITLTTSNVGGINFYKNDTLIPTLGPKGTMVQNIIITRDGIRNVNPLSSGNNVVPINELHPNQNVVTPSIADTNKIKKTRQYTRRKKKEEPQKPIIIDFSKPENTKPPILENEKKD